MKKLHLGFLLLFSCGQPAKQRLGDGRMIMATPLPALQNAARPAEVKPESTPVTGGRANSDQAGASPLALVASADLTFKDEESRGGYLQGQIKYSGVKGEAGVTSHVLYWGADAQTKLPNSEPIALVDKNGGELIFALERPRRIPTNATHFLVFAKSDIAEAAQPSASVGIVDVGLPSESAISLGFTDSNPTGGRIAGALSITRAADEAGISEYVIYWATDSGAKMPNASPIGSVAKTGKNLSFTFPDNTVVPKDVSRFLVVTKNQNGEMASGESLRFDDLGLPKNAAAGIAFTDTNAAAGKLGGAVTVTKATIEDDFSEYVLYWGSSSTAKLAQLPPIARLPKGQPLVFTFSNDTAKPEGATHLLVRSNKDEGEMLTGPSLLIVDQGAQ